MTKLACGCEHTDTHWVKKCGPCAYADAIISARWAHDRVHPPLIKVYRVNGVIVQRNNDDVL